jgi:uncharacterized membrane protein
VARSDRVSAYETHDPRRASSRLILGVGSGALAFLCLPAHLGWALRAVASWDVSAAVLSVLCWLIIVRHDSAATQRRAAAEDPGRNTVWWLILIASALSLFASSFVLRHAKHQQLELQTIFAAMCLFAVGSAWALTHTAFALRYAHIFYRDDGSPAGGLEFPDHCQPDYFDFAYFAFTVGMCFQVSDVTISRGHLRRVVLGHAMLSFAYNTAIIAVALNLAIGLFE